MMLNDDKFDLNRVEYSDGYLGRSQQYEAEYQSKLRESHANQRIMAELAGVGSAGSGYAVLIGKEAVQAAHKLMGYLEHSLVRKLEREFSRTGTSSPPSTEAKNIVWLLLDVVADIEELEKIISSM
ncbi:hypothetical protein Ddc_19150 [Ditylenchus destructor]|nr:hypothetical protein Ddc_19150 [Ditylenchus destructor]